MWQLHSQNGVTRFNGSEVNAHIRLCPRVWLDVGVFRAEQFFCTFDGEGFGVVDEFAAAIVAAARIAFRVFIRHHRRAG